MLRNRLEKWEKKLKGVLDQVDDFLEDNYAEEFPRKRTRPERGATANKAYDGLFEVGAKFSLGIGSAYGEGYVIEVRLATPHRVRRERLEKIEEQVAELLNSELPKAFPGRELRVVKDQHVYKIYGDLHI